jgi:hypothetical protein
MSVFQVPTVYMAAITASTCTSFGCAHIDELTSLPCILLAICRPSHPSHETNPVFSDPGLVEYGYEYNKQLIFMWNKLPVV